MKMTLTLSKWGLGSPPGLPKLQSSIARVKTSHFEALPIFLNSLLNTFFVILISVTLILMFKEV